MLSTLIGSFMILLNTIFMPTMGIKVEFQQERVPVVNPRPVEGVNMLEVVFDGEAAVVYSTAVDPEMVGEEVTFLGVNSQGVRLYTDGSVQLVYQVNGGWAVIVVQTVIRPVTVRYVADGSGPIVVIRTISVN